MPNVGIDAPRFNAGTDPSTYRRRLSGDPVLENEPMDEKRNRISQYTGGAVVVVSAAPLTGKVELAVAGEEPVFLQLDRKSARQLASALLDFLGDDVPPK